MGRLIRFFGLLVVLFNLIACNESLIFPPSLSFVKATRYVGDIFTAPSNKFFFYVLPPLDTDWTDWIVIVQVLPDGKRKLAIFDENLKRLSVEPEIDYSYGKMHGVSSIYAFIGSAVFERQNDLIIRSTNSFDRSDRDKILAIDDGQAYVVQGTYLNNTCIIKMSEYAIPPDNIIRQIEHDTGLGNLCTVLAAKDDLIILRQNNSFVGYLYKMKQNFCYSLDSTIIENSVCFAADNRIVFETKWGTFERFRYFVDNWSIFSYLEADYPSATYTNYLIAYGFANLNDMYLFSPTARQLFKCKSWPY